MGRWIVAAAAAGALAALLSSGAGARVALREAAASPRFAAYGELDCNGYSRIQRPLKPLLPCTDLSNYDNGHYVGHDEPEVQFFSNEPGSGSDLQWTVTLPVDPPLPGTQTFENEIAYWFGLALCDPFSYPQNPCKPDSDENPSGIRNENAAGAAFLEMQFYPPGLPLQPVSSSCDRVHWCAAMGVFSLECLPGATSCNENCEEPVNFAFIQRDGVPTGPPGPAESTPATFTPNARTLLMAQGDRIRVTIKDSPAGLVNEIDDLTSGQSGFMVASVKNGFEHLAESSCAPHPFAFHPEFSSAKETNDLPWSIGIRNVAYSAEIGHFEKDDGDSDDKYCFPGPVIAGCEGADVDFDGTSYRRDWPDGTAQHAASIEISSTPGNGFGPVSMRGGEYRAGYATIRFVTGVPASEYTCRRSVSGCKIPPPGAQFYPFYAASRNGSACFLTLGSDIAGSTTDDFGGEKQWGGYDERVPYTWQSDFIPNPCTPH